MEVFSWSLDRTQRFVNTRSPIVFLFPPKDTVRDLFPGIRLSLDHGMCRCQVPSVKDPLLKEVLEISKPNLPAGVMSWKIFSGPQNTMGNPKGATCSPSFKDTTINSFDIGECGTRCDPIWSKVLFVSIMNTAFILHKVDPMTANVNFLSSLSGVNHLRGHLLISHFIAMAWSAKNLISSVCMASPKWGRTTEKITNSLEDLWTLKKEVGMTWWHGVTQKKGKVLGCHESSSNLTCPYSKHVMYTAVQYTDKPNEQTLAFQEQNEKGIRPVNNKIAHLQEISYRTHWMDP